MSYNEQLQSNNERLIAALEALSNGFKGEKGDKGDKGDTGRGISSVSKTSTSGLVDTYTITYTDGTKTTYNVSNGAKGDKGDPFAVAKVYSSVSAMNSGYSSDGVAVGGFVVIDTGNVSDEENARLYVKGTSSYTYLTDLSGAQGMKGEKGDKGDTGGKGDTGATGATGADGQRGTGVLKVTTPPTNYSTITAGVKPMKRMALATILSQSKASEVLVGDQIFNQYYLFRVYYCDDTYAYMDQVQSIRGSAGADGEDGYTPVKGTDYFTDADKAEMVDLVLAALPIWTGGSY